jgi:protein phosphatase PTC7
MQEEAGPRAMAQQLAALGHQLGTNARTLSPFAKAAASAGFSFEGGKLDDVTVVVCFVE